VDDEGAQAREGVRLKVRKSLLLIENRTTECEPGSIGWFTERTRIRVDQVTNLLNK